MPPSPPPSTEPADHVVQAFDRAVEARDPDAIRRLVGEHPELTRVLDRPRYAFDCPALVHVAAVGNRAVLDALIDVGADPDARSAWAAGPYTALTRLLDAGGPAAMALARHLVARGATVDLHAAAGLGDLARLAELLDDAPERVDERGPDGATPLHLAATPEVAAFLLDRGADIDRRCVDHRSTPAMWAIAQRPEVTRFLVTRGARPDLFMAAALGDVDLARRVLDREPEAVDVRLRPGAAPEHLGGGDKYVWALDFADTPLEVARRRRHEAFYRWLLERSPPWLRLVQAARRVDLTELEALLARHPRIVADARPAAIATLLDVPAGSLRRLLALGVDPNVVDDDPGATPLHHAAWKGEAERVRLLLEAGADPTVLDRTHSSTPLGWARHNGQRAVVEILERLDGADQG